MTTADIPILIDIDAESRGIPWSAGTFQKEIDNPLCRAVVFTSGSEIVGFALSWIVGDEVQIHHIAIRQAWRRRGVGSKLLADALNNGREQGASVATLDVRAGNLPARRLYEKFGFVEVGRRPGYYREPADDAVLMNANL